MAGLREQAGVQLALGRETVTRVRQRAAGAERLHRNDWHAASDARVNGGNFLGGHGGLCCGD